MPARRRYLLDSVSEYTWRTQHSDDVMGIPTVYLPRAIKETSTVVGGQIRRERFNTEIVIAATARFGHGYWHSFGEASVALAYFTALHNFDVEGSDWYGYWEPANPITTATPDCVVSCWVRQDRVLAAVVNLQDVDRGEIFLNVPTNFINAQNRYAGGGISYNEGRGELADAFVPSAPLHSGIGQWRVGVGRKNLTLVEFSVEPEPPPDPDPPPLPYDPGPNPSVFRYQQIETEIRRY